MVCRATSGGSVTFADAGSASCRGQKPQCTAETTRRSTRSPKAMPPTSSQPYGDGSRAIRAGRSTHPDLDLLARRRRGLFRRLQRRVLRSVTDLQTAINRVLEDHNAQSELFQWFADPTRSSPRSDVGAKRYIQFTSGWSDSAVLSRISTRECESNSDSQIPFSRSCTIRGDIPDWQTRPCF